MSGFCGADSMSFASEKLGGVPIAGFDIDERVQQIWTSRTGVQCWGEFAGVLEAALEGSLDRLRSCLLNLAQCALKLDRYDVAVETCSQLLEMEGEAENVKALYRRGVAQLAMQRLEEAGRGSAASRALVRNSRRAPRPRRPTSSGPSRRGGAPAATTSGSTPTG